MKNLILYLFSLLLPAGLLAQDRADTNELTGFTSVNEAGQVAEQIVKASGLEANFAIAEADVPNAVAVLKDGRRYILYNPRFMNTLTRVTGTKWAAISVLAHEIGHHLYGTGSTGKPKMATELQADEFSGYVLEKMGATLPEAQAAMSFLSTSQASLTHPAKADRILSIAKGWKNAGGTGTGEDEDGGNVLARSDNQPAVPEPEVTAAIYFNANPQGTYYVTKEMNVLSVGNSRVVTIGRITRSGSTQYPYIIYDNTGYRLYVHNSGIIYTTSGKVVGRIKAVTPDA